MVNCSLFSHVAADCDSYRDRDFGPRGEPFGLRLPAADQFAAGALRVGGQVLRAGTTDVPEPVGWGRGSDRNRHGSADGRLLHPGDASLQEERRAAPVPTQSPHRVQRFLVLPPPSRRCLPAPLLPWLLCLPHR